MTLPTWFEEELRDQFQGRYRVRWSEKRQRWQWEEKKYRAIQKDRPISSIDDEGLREIEGFELIGEICPGTTHRCNRCERQMRVTEQRFKTSVCPSCRKENKMCFWAFGPSLLEHMRKVDPLTGGIDRAFTETEGKTVQREKEQRTDGRNYRESAGKDSFNYVHEIQSVGFTGKSNRFVHRDKGLR